MDGYAASDGVLAVADLRDYFRESIDSAINKQGVLVNPHTAHYVVNLLTMFSRSEELYEDHGEGYGLRPLALMMADAVDATTQEQRANSLQRIGDVALFIAGFFADSLSYKPVDVDYYITMGGNAYGSLSEEVRGTYRGKAFAPIYRELAAKFQVLVDVLNEVRDEARRESDIDLLRTYDIWLKTGSARARRLLRQKGVVPISDAKSRERH